MARYIFQGTFRDGQGNIVSDADVYVYLAGTTTAASIYTAESGGSSTDHVTSDSVGYFYFYIDGNDYNNSQKFKLKLYKDGYTIKYYDNIRVIDERGNVDYLSNYENFASAISSIGSTEATLVLDCSGAVTTDITVPVTLDLVGTKTGLLTISNTKTLTINGSFDAGDYQVFSGAGSVAGLSSAKVEWFGAVADGLTDDTDAVNKAIVALSPNGGRITVPHNSSVNLSNLVFPDNASFAGTKWSAGSRGYYDIIFLGSTLTDDIFISRTLSHGYQSNGYWSGMRLSGGHNPSLVLEPKITPISTSLTSGYQAYDGDQTSILFSGRDGDDVQSSLFQITSDPNNTHDGTLSIRTRLNADKGACIVYEDVSPVEESGTCTNGSTTTVIDGTKAWVVNAYAGKYVRVRGANPNGVTVNQVRKILSNDGTTLTIDETDAGPFYFAPTSSYSYSIGALTNSVEISNWAVIPHIDITNADITRIRNSFDFRYYDESTDTLGKYTKVSIDSSGNLFFNTGDNSPSKYFEIAVDGSIAMNAGGNGVVKWTSYAGSPENNVTAEKGSLCSDVTNGKLYVKETGSSNTGWVVK